MKKKSCFDNADFFLSSIISVEKIFFYFVNLYIKYKLLCIIFCNVIKYSEWLKPEIKINSFIWNKTYTKIMQSLLFFLIS